MNRSVWSRVSVALVLVSMSGVAGGAGLAGCSGDRPAPAAERVVAAAASTDDRPAVQVMADGSLELRPRLTDVSMLERQADGSYRRRCGRPSDQTRTMMEQAMRARRGIK